MASILKVALTELSSPIKVDDSVATTPLPLPVGRQDDIEQFAAGKQVVLCTVGTHHKLAFQPSFFESAVKQFSGKRLSIYQGHADSENYKFMPEPMEIGFITNLSFDGKSLMGDKFYTDVTALNNCKAGSEEALSIYWDAVSDIDSVVALGEVNGTNAILLSVARTKNPADKATIIPEVMLSESTYNAMQKRKGDIMDTKPIETIVPPAPAPMVVPVQELSAVIAEKDKIATELAAIRAEFEAEKTKYKTLSDEFNAFKAQKDKETASAKRNEKLTTLSKLMKEKMGKEMLPADKEKYTACSDEVIDEKISTLSEFTGVAFGGKVPTNVPAPIVKTGRGSNQELANRLKND